MALYSLVVHEVDTRSATIWVGSLSQYNKKPKDCRLRCFPTDKPRSRKISPEPITAAMWQRPFSEVEKRFFHTCIFQDLEPRTHYTVVFEACVLKPNGKTRWETLQSGVFDTLPEVLPGLGERPFTVALGSCFYPHYDGGQAVRAYKALYDHDNGRQRADISLLTGDQVYLDINLFFPLNKEDTRDRIADDYAECWRELGGILNRGGTWMLPDDHELWNNYPVTAGINPYVQALKHSTSFRRNWERFAKEGITNVQRVQPVRIINVGNELSVCLADLRTQRKVSSKNKPQQLMRETDFKKVIRWINRLQGPGVLTIAQPLLDHKGTVKTDFSLANFTQHYKQLVKAIADCEHDIVILSGDVHFGRISQVKVGEGAGRIIEVISSPFSNLTGKDSVAAATPASHKELVDFPAIKVPGVASAKIVRMASVDTEENFWDFRYLTERTKEHFMTLSFARGDSGKVVMKVQAWKLRDIDAKGLPAKQYRTEHAFELA